MKSTAAIRRVRDAGLNIVSPAAALLGWQLLADHHVIDPRVVSSPSAVASTAVQMVAHDSLMNNVGDTLWRFIVGLVVGALAGALLGTLAGLTWWTRAFLTPYVAAGLATPLLATFPAILLIFGIGSTSYLIMIAVGPFFIMAVNGIAAIARFEPDYLDVARSFGTGRRDLYRRVIVPAVIPDLVSGLRLSVGAALLGTVAVEYLLVQNGLGYVIWQSWEILSLRQSMLGVVVIGLIGYASYRVADFLSALVDWRIADRHWLFYRLRGVISPTVSLPTEWTTSSGPISSEVEVLAPTIVSPPACGSPSADHS